MGFPLLITAPSIVCYINGKVYALVSGVDFGISTPRKEVKAIDILTSLELLPLGVSVSCTFDLYRLRGGGGAQGAGMSATLPNISRENYFSVQLVDLATKLIVFRADNCSVEDESWTQAPKSLMTGRVRFRTLDYSNEVIPINQ